MTCTMLWCVFSVGHHLVPVRHCPGGGAVAERYHRVLISGPLE